MYPLYGRVFIVTNDTVKVVPLVPTTMLPEVTEAVVSVAAVNPVRVVVVY